MTKLAALGVIALVAACFGQGSASTETASSLDGRRFVVSELVVDGQSIDVSGSPPTMEFSGERIVGNSGCNSYFAHASFGLKVGFRVTDLGGRLMACGDSRTDIESGFTTALLAVDRWVLETGTLTLTDTETDTEIVLVDAGPAPIN